MRLAGDESHSHTLGECKQAWEVSCCPLVFLFTWQGPGSLTHPHMHSLCACHSLLHRLLRWVHCAVLCYAILCPPPSCPPPNTYIHQQPSTHSHHNRPQPARLCDRCHIILANLRKPGERGYKIPSGFLFNYITCANYTAEIWGWILFTIGTRTLAAGLFTAAGAFQMADWARGKHKRLVKVSCQFWGPVGGCQGDRVGDHVGNRWCLL